MLHNHLLDLANTSSVCHIVYAMALLEKGFVEVLALRAPKDKKPTTS
ncbi:hypothetical protein [Pseudoalteromonas sp. GCY]|nr:hypothetical protein [Pseudoalteromonas sp. GCY]